MWLLELRPKWLKFGESGPIIRSLVDYPVNKVYAMKINSQFDVFNKHDTNSLKPLILPPLPIAAAFAAHLNIPSLYLWKKTYSNTHFTVLFTYSFSKSVFLILHWPFKPSRLTLNAPSFLITSQFCFDASYYQFTQPSFYNYSLSSILSVTHDEHSSL